MFCKFYGILGGRSKGIRAYARNYGRAKNEFRVFEKNYEPLAFPPHLSDTDVSELCEWLKANRGQVKLTGLKGFVRKHKRDTTHLTVFGDRMLDNIIKIASYPNGKKKLGQKLGNLYVRKDNPLLQVEIALRFF
jgi:hypothetical protein